VTPYLKGQNVSVMTLFMNTISVICALLSYYAASNGNPLPTFRDFLTLEDGADTLSRNVSKDYHWTLRNTAEGRRSHQQIGGSLKSPSAYVVTMRDPVSNHTEQKVYQFCIF
jgi:hypothetical protein